MDPRALRQRLEASAKALGFDAFGVAPVEVDVRADYFKKWIADGMPRPERGRRKLSLPVVGGPS